MHPIEKILKEGSLKQKRSLFSFDKSNSLEQILFKFNLWSRYFFPKYFKSPDASFHEDININNLKVYRSLINSFINIAFRGAGKDIKTKLFICFVILNDLDHSRRYFKVLAEDGDNSKQAVTDIYNMLVIHGIAEMYPETFEKTEAKREEKMNSFTTSTGIKVTADTVGVEQRGQIQEDARPDFIWFNDFETRKTLRSARETKNIWENMEEARTGLDKEGGCVYTCNYISEQGNVHKLVTERLSDRKEILIIPIWDKWEKLTWPERYSRNDVLQLKKEDEDFEGERLCKPNASKDVYFDRARLEKMEQMLPQDTIGSFKIFKKYRPDHRYGSGHDVAGGVGLDSSTSVFIDFDVIPAQVAGTFKDNMIQPESFGDEIYSQGNRYGRCIQNVENNKYDSAILKAKLLGANLFKTGGKEIKVGYKPPLMYGWNTNSLTKSKMLSALRLAVEDGLIELNDPDLIKEAISYTRNDLLENVGDPRDTTRHFDLLIAAALAWQMKDHAIPAPRKTSLEKIWTQKKNNVNPAL